MSADQRDLYGSGEEFCSCFMCFMYCVEHDVFYDVFYINVFVICLFFFEYS